MPSGAQLTSAHARADYTNQSSLQYGCTVLTVPTAVRKRFLVGILNVHTVDTIVNLLFCCTSIETIFTSILKSSSPVLFFFGNHRMSSSFHQTYLALLHWKEPNLSWWKRYLDLLTSDWHQFQFCTAVQRFNHLQALYREICLITQIRIRDCNNT